MQQNWNKIVGLLVAAALWLAAPAATAAQPDAVQENSFYLYDEEYGYYDADDPPWAYSEMDSAEAVYLEPNVSTFSSDGLITTMEKENYYEITIPESVSWSDSDEKQETTFQMTGTLHPYRRLTVYVSSNGENKLTCGEQKLDYTLTASSSDSNLTVESDMTCKADTDADKKVFTANYKLAVTGTPTVSGEYSDTLTFEIVCVPKTYTVTYHINNGTDTKPFEQTVECGTSATLEDNRFLNGLMTFAGWSTEANYTQTVEAYEELLHHNDVMTEWVTTTEDKNYDLYAQWGYLCTLTVKYEAADGSIETGGETHSKVVPENESYTWKRKRNAYNPTDEKMWQETSCDFGMVTEDKTINTVVRRNLYDVILKGVLDDEGIESEDISKWGSATIYINGKLVAAGESSYRYGSTIAVEATPNEGYAVTSYEYKQTDKNEKGEHILTGDSEVIVHFKKATTETTQSLLPGDSLPVVDGELLPEDAAVYEPSDAIADSTFVDSDSYWNDDTYYDDSDTYPEPDYAPLVNPWADR